jgi:hypothetical protein
MKKLYHLKKMASISKLLLLLVAVSVVFNSCDNASAYEKLLKSELAKNERRDSLFLDITFGMDSKEFYKHCWELNKKGLVKQGPGNLSVEYKLDSGFRYPVYMQFYPKFFEDKISRMPVEFSYMNWAPWNKNTSADTLLNEVKREMGKWYGNEFRQYNDNGNLTMLINVQANRLIKLSKKDLNTVKAEYIDLTRIKNKIDRVKEDSNLQEYQ